MRLGSDDTIFALATGAGRSALATFRVSGANAVRALGEGRRPQPRRATLRALRAHDGGLIDRGLVLWMPGPATATGEDVVEWHLHGGPAVRAAALAHLGSLDGFRLAEPGEFTRRALLNGRMDLTAVEGLADLIDAETEAQRRQALRQMEGALGGQVETWRGRLIDVLARLDAAFDFSDEADVPADVTLALAERVLELRNEVTRELGRGRQGERLREGLTVVIAGPPNAGKSMLLNALARRDVAIVSPIAGTTRDAIEVRCDLDGLPVTFVDTAGLRDSNDPVEAIGVARTQHRAREADIVLWLTPSDDDSPPPPRLTEGRLMSLGTKQDLAPSDIRRSPAVSALTGFGLDELLARLGREAEDLLGHGGDALVTRERHRVALEGLVAALGRAIDRLGEGHEELAAEDIRLGLRALGRITGEVDVEDVLDRIFSSFCIGK